MESLSKFFELLSKIGRKFILKIIKFSMWILPIIFITNTLYVGTFGIYELNFEEIFIKEFILTSNPWYAFGVFSFVFIIAYYFEDLILPYISLFILTKPDIERKPRYIMYKILKNALGVNIFKGFTLYFRMEGKINFYRSFSFFPCSLILWGGYFLFSKVWLSLLLLIGAILSIIVFCSIINVLEEEFKVTNTKMEKIGDLV